MCSYVKGLLVSICQRTHSTNPICIIKLGWHGTKYYEQEVYKAVLHMEDNNVLDLKIIPRLSSN